VGAAADCATVKVATLETRKRKPFILLQRL
jgi:hypothetical protein